MSRVTESHNAKAVVVSAVNGSGDDFTVVAKVGLVVNNVVPAFPFISIVVLLVVPAVHTHKSAHITLIGSIAT